MADMRKQELTVDETVTLQAQVRPRTKTTDPSVMSQQTEVPAVCDFRKVRALVMKAVWQDADELEARGEPLTNELWAALVKKHWAEAKEEAKKVCRPLSPQQVSRLLGGQ